MAICIDGNFVCFDGSLGRFCATPTGLAFRGEASATCLCDLRSFQGSTSGYVAGGSGLGLPTGGGESLTRIDKFPFASGSFTASKAGDLTVPRNFCGASTGGSSDVNGYTYGGRKTTFGGVPTLDQIEKFPFTSDTPASEIANIAQFPQPGNVNAVSNGQNSDIIGGNGYNTGYQGCGSTTNVSAIEKYPFQTDTPASCIGCLNKARTVGSPQTSTTHGYVTNGSCGGPPTNTTIRNIDKFPFASDTNATDVGDAVCITRTGTGLSSQTHGYQAGGTIPTTGADLDSIQKFPFSSDVNSTDIAELGFMCVVRGAGSSSTTGGYVSGGCGRSVPTPQKPNTDCAHRFVQCFPFASDANGACVGDVAYGTPGPQRPEPFTGLKTCLFGKVDMAGFQV